MKTSIGIRVSPEQVYFSVVNEQDEVLEIKLVDRIVVPKSLETPEQLKFLRSTLGDIIFENKITLACIRITESNARKIRIPRIYMEGVIQELIASSTIQKYYVGQISSISAKLGMDRELFKPLAIGKEVFIELKIWKDICLEDRYYSFADDGII